MDKESKEIFYFSILINIITIILSDIILIPLLIITQIISETYLSLILANIFSFFILSILEYALIRGTN